MALKFLLFTASAFGLLLHDRPGTEGITVPAFNDTYCNYVKDLESGRTDIDYRAFRESFLKSEQFSVAAGRLEEFDSLEKVMYGSMKAKDYPAIISITQAMLSIDYTSMIAHKVLRQTYQFTGDTALALKYKAIQFGLLNSIVRNGDGKTCATGWPVIQVSEEYFILQMLGAELQKQSVDHQNGICDRMEVIADGEKRTYFFEVSKVFEGYQRQFKR